MGIDDFAADGSDTPEKDTKTSDSWQSSESTSDGADYETPAEQTPSGRDWQTKLDFGKPYVMIAKDRSGTYYTSKDNGVIIDEAGSWKRITEVDKGNFPKDHTVWEKDMAVVALWGSKSRWLRFCDLVDKQFGEDAADLLENDVDKLLGIKPDVQWPPASKPTNTRTCRVCGDTSSMNGVELIEIDLHYTRKANVCPHHSVEELAENGLLS
jgi:hypothetical protein